MKCIKCNQDIPNRSKFCFICGAEQIIKSDYQQVENPLKESDVTASEVSTRFNDDSSKVKIDAETPVEVENIETTDDIKSEEDTEVQEAPKIDNSLYDSDEEIESVGDILSSLSSTFQKQETKESEKISEPKDTISYMVAPDQDPYWDDVLPEINDEINAIPWEIIVKGIGLVIGVAVIIYGLFYIYI